MGYGCYTTEELIKKIAERKMFLKKVIEFVEDVVLNHGDVVSRVQGSSNTHVVKKFDVFENFLFVTDWGQTMMGGNDVKIWYGQNSEDINPDKNLPVLHVYYQGVFNINDDCVVKRFDEDDKWQTAIKQAFRHKNRLLSQFFEIRENSKKQKEAKNEALSERGRIEKEAKRLGF